MNCKNCNTVLENKYCPTCGAPASLKKIDAKYILHEIEHLLHLEKGFFYTTKVLLTKPGNTIKIYLTENRSKLFKPINYIIVTSLIYTLISNFFHIEEDYVNTGVLNKNYIGKIFKWVQANYGYTSILIGFFTAFWFKIFFKKQGYNLFELIVALCFLQGISMLIFGVFGIIEGFTGIKLLFVSGLLGTLYIVWGMSNFFDAKKVSSYLKSLVAFLLGSITFYIIIAVIGLTLDLINKNG
jgi:hypothetical protein